MTPHESSPAPHATDPDPNHVLRTVAALNLILRFILELAALAAFAYWGFRTGESPITRTVLGVGTPLFAAWLWGAFVAPRARWRVSAALRLLVELAVFANAAYALAAAGQPTLAVVVAVAAAVSSTLHLLLRRHEPQLPEPEVSPVE